MIREQRYKIKQLREKGKDISESNAKRSISKDMGRIIHQGIQELKGQVDKDNPYKKYIKENEELITKRHGFNVIVQNYDKAVELLKTLDIRYLLNIEVKLNVPFESKLFLKIEDLDGELYDTEAEVNEAIKAIESDDKKIISYDIRQTKFGKWTYNVTYSSGTRKVYINTVKGQYKLFFKRNVAVDRGIEEESFDIINIYELIMLRENTYKIIKELCFLFNIKIKYCIEQEAKYDFNIDRIYDKKQMKTNYPILFKFIDRHSDLLVLLLENGKKCIKTSRNTFKQENIFFCSGNYLQEEFEEKFKNRLIVKAIKQNQICKLINTFCALGLIIKLKRTEVPEQYRRTQKGVKGINYFIIKRYTEDVLIEAQERAYKLNKGKNRISATKMNEKNCKELLGKEICESVYINNKEDLIENEEKDLKDVS